MIRSQHARLRLEESHPEGNGEHKASSRRDTHTRVKKCTPGNGIRAQEERQIGKMRKTLPDQVSTEKCKAREATQTVRRDRTDA